MIGDAISTKCAIFDNQSTITIIIILSLAFGRSLTKSIEASIHTTLGVGTLGVGKGRRIPDSALVPFYSFGKRHRL